MKLPSSPASLIPQANQEERPLKDQPRHPSRVTPQIDHSRVDPQLLKAAEGMEEMFLNHMMNVMRKTVQKSQMSLDSNATKIYQGMLDSEYSKMAAKTGGIGLAELIIAYADPSRYTDKRRHPSRQGQSQDSRSNEAPSNGSRRTGGTR